MDSVILTEGHSEWDILPAVFDRCPLLSPKPMVRRVQIDPHESLERIAQKVFDFVKDNLLLSGTAPLHLILTLDLDKRPDCIKEYSTNAVRLIQENCLANNPELKSLLMVDVVIKVHGLESWLIADSEAFQELSETMPDSHLIRQRVQAVADVSEIRNPKELLEKACRGKRYKKRQGANEIASHINIHRAALKSRSLRRLLRVLGVPPYQNQSRIPTKSEHSCTSFKEFNKQL